MSLCRWALNHFTGMLYTMKYSMAHLSPLHISQIFFHPIKLQLLPICRDLFEESVNNLEDHSLECHKSRTQIIETLSKPMSGILFGIILKTQIWSFTDNIKWRSVSIIPSLILLCFLPNNFPSNYGIIHSIRETYWKPTWCVK